MTDDELQEEIDELLSLDPIIIRPAPGSTHEHVEYSDGSTAIRMSSAKVSSLAGHVRAGCKNLELTFKPYRGYELQLNLPRELSLDGPVTVEGVKEIIDQLIDSQREEGNSA